MTTTHALEFGVIPAAVIGSFVAIGYTATEITGFVGAIAVFTTALFTGIIGLVTAIRTTRRKVEENTAKVEENTAITLQVKEAVKVVEGHVNSAASKSLAENEALTKELVTLRADMAELKAVSAAQLAHGQQIAALVAQERAFHGIQSSAAVGAPSTGKNHLQEIEKNTGQTVVAITEKMHEDKAEILDAVKEKDAGAG